MVRRLNLLIFGFVGLAIVPVTFASSALAAPTSCTSGEQRAGICTSGHSNGDSATVAAAKNHEKPGSVGTFQKPAPQAQPARRLTDAELQALLDEVCYGAGTCTARDAVALNPRIPAQPPTDDEPDEAPAVVTITDVARFLPAAATLHAEPDGWAVVGVPANFWVDVSPVTVSAPLLDDTAQVRFTPQAFRFDYGDGTARTTSTPGASWDGLHEEELTETSTSHVYAGRGDRRASVTVVYSAQYRFADGPWIAVAGAVSGSTPPQRELVVVERTALTNPA